MATGTWPGDLYVQGSITSTGNNSPSAGVIVNSMVAGNAGLESTKFATESRPVAAPFTHLRVAAAQKDDLPDTPNGTSLGLTDAPGGLLTGTQTNNTSASETCVWEICLPHDYVSGAAITLRIRAKVSAARFVSATVDATVKQIDDSGLGSDINATAAADLTTSYADNDFTVTPTGLVAGDKLSIIITLATNDTGGSTNGTPTISEVQLICGCR